MWQCKHLQVPEHGIGNFLQPPSLRKIRKKYRNKKKGRRQKKIQKEKDFLRYQEENPEENITFSY